MKILSFGEILWDLYPNEKYLGGAPLNFAAHAAKCGEEAYMYSAVGADDLGNDALERIEKWGVNRKYIDVLPNFETGKCLVTLDENSVPKYDLLTNVAYDHIEIKPIEASFEVLYFGTLSLRSHKNFESLKSLINTTRFPDIFVDVNLRKPFYDVDSAEFAAKVATVIKISLEEMEEFGNLLGISSNGSYKDFANTLKSRYDNLRCILITLGDGGAYALDCEKGKEYFCPAEEVKPVSTVGAGDSFSAGFLHKYLRGETKEKCLEFASKIAAFVVGRFDAVPEYDIKDFE